jgi:aldehyde:ferredoxin oxidoreductase
MTEDLYGWTGNFLRVDLTTGRISKEPSVETVKKFIGGVGVGAKLMWDEVKPDVTPFDERNRLLFLTGPLTGTLAPTSGRMEVYSKAPGVDPPSCTRSGLGGRFGPELKFAGYDGLIVQGKAEKPVLLVIEDGKVEIKDANYLWGKDTYETQEEIWREYGERFQTVCIGPAGENLVHYAAIMHLTGHAAAKAGVGAVMGSKKLKAITVRGSGGVKIARQEEFTETCRQIRRLIINHPVKKWTCQGPIDVTVSFADKYRTKYNACWGCPVACRTWIEMPGMDPGEMMCLASYYLWLGAKDKEAWEGKVLADRLGICQYTIFDAIRWLQDCFKAGIISEEETKIPWSKVGSSEFINTLLRKISYREGFGDIIADRTSRAAEQLGPKAVEIHEAYFPAYSSCQHYSVRAYPEVLMQWATDNRDPLSDAHDWICLVYWAGLYWPRSEKGALTFEKLKELAKEAWGSEKAGDPFSYEYKAQTAIIVQNMSRLKNSLVLCDWSIFPILSSPNTADHRGDPDAERKLYCAATGHNLSREEWLTIGERIFNLERAIMAREGRRKKNDTVKDYYFKVPETEVAPWESGVEIKPTSPPVVDRKEFEKMRDEYYQLRGINVETGVPGKAKLEELGLSDVAKELSSLGII